MAKPSEFGGVDGDMFAQVEAGAPVDPMLEAIAYRRSARAAEFDIRGVAVPRSPRVGQAGTRVS